MYNECRHIFTSGRKCQSPALTDQNFCYFHSNTRKRPTPRTQPYEPYIEPQANVLDLPPLEDADSIQLALSDVILALAANRIDPRRARILIYGLQVASQNNSHRHALAEREAEQEVQTMVRETHRHEDGSIIGPTKQTPDPEEAAEQKRPPSLGEILLREAEALRLRKEEEARLNAESQTQPTTSITLAHVHATADHRSTTRDRTVTGNHRRKPKPPTTIQQQLRVNCKSWRGGRVVDGSGLENRHTRKGIGGSNPSLSASF